MTYNYKFTHDVLGEVDVDASSLKAAKFRLERYDGIDPKHLTLISTTDLRWSNIILKNVTGLVRLDG